MIDDLIKALQQIRREERAMFVASQKCLNRDITPKQRGRYRETANDCAREISRLKHEAHCLAVEIGIADRRESYQDGVQVHGLSAVHFARRAPRDVA